MCSHGEPTDEVRYTETHFKRLLVHCVFALIAFQVLLICKYHSNPTRRLASSMWKVDVLGSEPRAGGRVGLREYLTVQFDKDVPSHVYYPTGNIMRICKVSYN